MGFDGVQNFPTVGLIDGVLPPEPRGDGHGLRPRGRRWSPRRTRLDLLTCPYVFDADSARAMATAGADVLVAHLGLTTKGSIGAKTALTLDESAARVQAMHDAARAVRKDVIVICHGGPIAEPADVEYVLAHTNGIAGFFGASSIERLATEVGIEEQARRFRGIALPGEDAGSAATAARRRCLARRAADARTSRNESQCDKTRSRPPRRWRRCRPAIFRWRRWPCWPPSSRGPLASTPANPQVPCVRQCLPQADGRGRPGCGCCSSATRARITRRQLLPLLAAPLARKGIQMTHVMTPDEALVPVGAAALRRARDLRQPQDADAGAGAGARRLRRGRQGPGGDPLRLGDVHRGAALHPARRRRSSCAMAPASSAAEIVKPDHPVMQGLKPFKTWDETYVHARHNTVDRTVLMERVDAEGREPYTWVRTQGKGRVFYTAFGHDERTWRNPGFQQLVEQRHRSGRCRTTARQAWQALKMPERRVRRRLQRAELRAARSGAEVPDAVHGRPTR